MNLSPLWMTGRPSTESDREDSGKWSSIQRREQSEFYVPPYPSAPRRRLEEMIYTNSVFYKVHVLCYLGNLKDLKMRLLGKKLKIIKCPVIIKLDSKALNGCIMSSKTNTCIQILLIF